MRRLALLAAAPLRTSLAAALPALLLVGCSAVRPAAPPADAALLVLINRADVPVRYVYLSPCESGDWGPDRLESDEVVMPGQTRTFALEPGCWDARAVFRDDREAEERSVEMTRGSQRTWTVLEPEG